jgi:tetraacyldisaccharide 4'-kinase
VVSILLLPLTLIYCIVVLSKRIFAKKVSYDIPIISIGNLIVGGSGKTPIAIELAKDMQDIAIILRGYKRDSKGLVIVSNRGDILVDTSTSGDEAMLFATSLSNATVIVSEDRVKAIHKAKEMGIKAIFLDDGFSKSSIKKLDILIKPHKQPTNIFCLPSGGYREPRFLYSIADIVLHEKIDFSRDAKIKEPTEDMILITAISKPERLNEYIPKDIPKYHYPDHYSFSQDEIKELVNKHSATSVIVTTKDYVKIKDFDINYSILELNISIDKKIREKINNYIKNYNK